MTKITILCSLKIKPNRGGPTGYLANLQNGLPKNQRTLEFITPAEHRTFKVISRIANIIKNKKTRETLLNKIKGAIIRRELKRREPNFIMCHSPEDLVATNQIYLRSLQSLPKPKWILMCHSPTLPSEQEEELQTYAGITPNVADVQRIEREAFTLADYICKPSPHSMDAYENKLSQILKQKKEIIIASGCPPLQKIERNAVRSKFNIRTRFVICYIGRHWKTKGYERLKDIARSVLSTREDVTFLIAGKLNPAIPPLDHPRWIELGWAPPEEVFSASDIFLLASEKTYYDLVVPEALSIGLKCILSHVGGNRDFPGVCPQVDTFRSNEEAISLINSYFALSDQERQAISKEIKKTTTSFSQQRLSLIDTFIPSPI